VKLPHLKQTKVYAVEKQIAQVALHDDEVFKRLFEFYADLLDPEEFVRSGPNVTAFYDLKVVTSTGSPSDKPFSDFTKTYGFDNFYGKMDVNLDITKDFTIFDIVKIDFNVSSYYLRIRVGRKGSFETSYHFQKQNSIVILRTEFDGANNFLDLTGDKSKFVIKQIILWSTKKGNKLSETIAGIDPIETADTRCPPPPPPPPRTPTFFSSKQTFFFFFGFVF